MTPRGHECGAYQFDNGNPDKPRLTLTGQVMAPWPTPVATEVNKNLKAHRDKLAIPGSERTGGNGANLQTAVNLHNWPTPKSAPSGPDYARTGREGAGGDDLATTIAKATWATPTSRDFRHPNDPNGVSRQKRAAQAPNSGDQLPNQAGGALNPAWVEILMNWPVGWSDPAHPCPGTWPGWPRGLGPEQHDYEPPRTCASKTVPGRVARLRALGNGVVPAQAEAAFLILLTP